MRCTSSYPIAPSVVSAAKTRGFNRTQAYNIWKRSLPVPDHDIKLQGCMQTLSAGYKSPCWVKGLCPMKHGVHMRGDQQRLHGSLISEIQRQIGVAMPSQKVKDYLCSSDTCVAIRYRTLGHTNTNHTAITTAVATGMSSSSASSSASRPCSDSDTFLHCELFFLAKVVLKPMSAVLVALDIDDKPMSWEDELKNSSARFRMSQIPGHSDTDRPGFTFTTTWELVTALLQKKCSAIWVTLIKYNSSHHGCIVYPIASPLI